MQNIAVDMQIVAEDCENIDGSRPPCYNAAIATNDCINTAATQARSGATGRQPFHRKDNRLINDDKGEYNNG